MSRVIPTANINNIAGATAKTGVVTGKLTSVSSSEGYEKFTGQIVAVMTLDENLAPTIEHSIFTDADQAYSSIAFGNIMHCDSWEVRYIHLGKHICVVHVQKVNTNVDYHAFEIEKNLQKYYSNFTGIENDYRFATYWKITYFGQEKFNDEVDAISKLFELMKKNYT